MSETLSLNSILRYARVNPLHCFSKWPLDTVRNACLGVMNENNYPLIYDDYTADWAEQWIMFFLKEDGTRDYDTTEKLLQWYLMGTYDRQDEKINPFAIRAIEFAIELASDYKFAGIDGKITKTITRRMLKDDGPYLYPDISSIRKYLKYRLIRIFGSGIFQINWFGKTNYEIKEDDYSEGHWVDFERALKIILHVEDYRFTWILDQAYQLLLEGTICPRFGDFDSSVTRIQHMMTIDYSIKKLNEFWQEAIKEGISDKLESVQSLIDD